MTNHTVFELRDYALHPGRREALIDLFEARFIDSQNELGAHVRGIFRDIDRPDHFVWIRSFETMATRLCALEGFYSGPVWQAHRAAANATMIDSDDVHLLRPISVKGFPDSTIEAALIIVEILPDAAEQDLEAALAACPGLIAAFATHPGANDYPRLPVHAEKVVVLIRASPNYGPLERPADLPAPLATIRMKPTGRSPLKLAGPEQTPQDFDFLQGVWQVRNRKLRVRNAGSDDWEEFPASNRLWKLLDGVANVDEFAAPTQGFKGMSVRALDQLTGVWSIYWIASRGGVLLPPVRGGFVGTIGEFVGVDTDGSDPVMCRFRWQRNTQAPRWEQAFSYDGGSTWETNWTMDFERA